MAAGAYRIQRLRTPKAISGPNMRRFRIRQTESWGPKSTRQKHLRDPRPVNPVSHRHKQEFERRTRIVETPCINTSYNKLYCAVILYGKEIKLITFFVLEETYDMCVTVCLGRFHLAKEIIIISPSSLQCIYRSSFLSLRRTTFRPIATVDRTMICISCTRRYEGRLACCGGQEHDLHIKHITIRQKASLPRGTRARTASRAHYNTTEG